MCLADKKKALPHRMPIILALIVAALAVVGPAHAEQVTSKYARFVVDSCPEVKGYRVFARRCRDKFGPAVIVADIAHTTTGLMFEPYFSEGRYEKESDDFVEANYGYQLVFPFLNKDGVLTIEWRVEYERKVWKPFAAIVRFQSSRDGGPKRVQHLAVIKLGQDQSCVIGGVEANKKNANALARKIADNTARQANCRTDRAWPGKNEPQ